MRLEQLEYFVEVAKRGSFSQAAIQLNVTQPTISQAIASLEKELNMQLLKRSRAGVTITDAGNSMLRRAQSIMNMVHEIEDEALSESASFTGTLHIASIPSMCNAFLGDVLAIYRKRYPQVQIEVTEDGTNQIIHDVVSNEMDIGLISSLPGEQIDNRLEFHHLITGTYLVCVGKNSSVPFYNPMPPEVIAQQPLITFKKHYRQEDYLKEILQFESLNTVFELGYTEAAKKLIAKGVAIGFYPDFAIRHDTYVQSGDIIPLELQGNNLPLSFGWIRSKNQHFSRAARMFVKVLKSVVHNTVE